VCGSVRFLSGQICAVTDSVSEQQWSVRSISSLHAVLGLFVSSHGVNIYK